MTPKDLRERINNGSISRDDILKAIDMYNSIVYDNELTTGLATAYNTYLIKAAKAIDMSIKELNDLALEKHPSRYIPAKYR